MWTAKRDKYALFAAEMREGGLCYVPLVFSCYGRAHPESAVALERIAAQAARRLGVRDRRGLLRRARPGLSGRGHLAPGSRHGTRLPSAAWY